MKGVLLLPVLLGVVSNGNGKEVLWDYCVCMCMCVCACYINMIPLSHIAYFFSSPFRTIEWKCIRNQIFLPVPLVSGLRPSLERVVCGKKQKIEEKKVGYVSVWKQQDMQGYPLWLTQPEVRRRWNEQLFC